MRVHDFERAPKGRLVQWTTDDGAVLRTPEDVDGALATCEDADFDTLCEVQDHLGQDCWLVADYPEDHPRPTLEVRFADGATLFADDRDCWFD